MRRLLILPMLAGGAAAQGQTLPPDESIIRFERDVVVGDRAVPGSSALGLRLGSFAVLPRVDVSGLYNDNILALERPRKDDFALRVAPAVLIQSNWSRHSLNLSAEGTFDRFAETSSENRNAYNVSGYGIAELGDDMRLRGLARIREDRESRESQNAFTLTNRPIRYRSTEGALGLTRTFTRLQLAAEGGYARYDFSDGTLPNGAVLAQDYRDANIWRLQGRAEFAQSPSFAYFAQVNQSWTRYSQDTLAGDSRNSRNLRALGGVRFELPVLARGEVGVGYVRSSYRDARFRRFSGLALSSRVLFFPSQLTTVIVDAQRQVNDAGLPNSSGYVQLRGGVQVNHELLRTLILRASAHFERDSFNGIDRRDKRFEGEASAEYALRNGWRIRLAYELLDLNSKGLDSYKSLTRNRATVGLRYAI